MQVMKEKQRHAHRKGFSFIELVIAMILTTFLLGGVLSAVTTTYQAERTLSSNLAYAENLRGLLYSVNFAVKNATVSYVLGEDRFKGKKQGLTPGWSYLGVEKYDDNGKHVENFCNYVWQPDPREPQKKDDETGKMRPNGQHVRQVLASFDPGSGNGFDFQVRSETNSRVLVLQIEQGAVDEDGKLTRKDIPSGKTPEQIPNRMLTTSCFAYNSRNIGALGRTGIAIAYRNDPIQFATEQSEGGGRFVMMSDVSGSMSTNLSKRGEPQKSRLEGLQECLKELINKLAMPSNSGSEQGGSGSIEVNLSTFSDATKQIFTFGGKGLDKPTAANDYGEGEDKQAAVRYFANPQKNREKLLSQVDQFVLGGSTNHADALRTCMAMLKKANDQKPLKNYVVLLTDGNPTSVNFATEKMATRENREKRYWLNTDLWRHTQTKNKLMLLNRNYDKGGYTGMIIGGFPVDYDNHYPPYEFFKNEPGLTDIVGFHPFHIQDDWYDMAHYTYNSLLTDDSFTEDMVDFIKVRDAVRNGTIKNEEEYREYLKNKIWGGEDSTETNGNLLPLAFYDNYNPSQGGLPAMEVSSFANYYQPVGWSQCYLVSNSFPQMKEAIRLNYNQTAAYWALQREYNDLMFDSFKNTYIAMKKQKCPVDKIWIIGFGKSRDVSLCQKMVDIINQVDSEKAEYVFADSTESLIKTFDKIVQVINDDLWFLDGPQPQD